MCSKAPTYLASPVAQHLSNASEVVVRADKAAYEKARDCVYPGNEPFNYQKPVAIIYLGTEEDASVVVSIAKAANCRICTRSGAHDYSGASICAGAIVADTSRLTAITINAAEGYATLQAGVRFGELYAALDEEGLAAVGGLCPGVSISGWALGGDWSMLAKYGNGCDNVLAYTLASANNAGLIHVEEVGPHSDYSLRCAVRVTPPTAL